VARSQFKAIVEIEGLKASQDLLKECGERAYHSTLLMEELSEMLEIAARARLAKAPWVPLTGGTVTRKASQGENTAIMRDEWRPIAGTPTRKGDALYAALDGGPGSYKLATRTTATYGVHTTGDLFYGRFVQNVKGTKRKLLAIPAEYAVGMTDKVATYILGI
jgi:hypothetical protein